MRTRLKSPILFTVFLLMGAGACSSISHGNFTAASSRRVLEDRVRRLGQVRGSNCEDYVGHPAGLLRIGTALREAMKQAAEGSDLIVDARISGEGQRASPFGNEGRVCLNLDGTAASSVIPAADHSVPAPEPKQPDAPDTSNGGFLSMTFNMGEQVGLITSAPVNFPAESLGEKVTGKNCSWYVFFIPVNHPLPHLDGAIADALEKAGPHANLLLDGTISATSMTSVLVGSGCLEVTATPAHSDLVE